MEKIEIKKERYQAVDEFRGFLVLCLIFYHGACLGAYEFGIAFLDKFFRFFTPAQPYFAAAFIALCGYCCVWSHSNLKRGLQVLTVALGVTWVTVVAEYIGINELILYGVLHLLATGLILSAALEKHLRKVGKIPSFVIAAIFFGLFLFTFNLQNGYFGFSGNLVPPDYLTNGNKLFILGFIDSSFYAGDYFPIMPWLFMFFFGWFIGNATGGKLPEHLKKSRIKPLGFLGRKALLVYIVHQPIWFIIFTLCDLIRG